MIKFNSKEDIIELTPLWKGERFPDGRPKVADKYLDKMRKMTLEELWKPIFLKGYESQFEGDLDGRNARYAYRVDKNRSARRKISRP